MHLSKYVLKKSGQTIVIQGIVHAGPSWLYKQVQADMNSYVAQGYAVRKEGVKRMRKFRSRDSYEKDVLNFLNLLVGNDYHHLRQAHGWVSQSNILVYPVGTVNLDVGLRGLICELRRRGFKIPLLFKLATSGQSSVDKFGSEYVQKRKEEYQPKPSKKGFGILRSFLLPNVDILLEVLVDWRNSKVVRMLETDNYGGWPGCYVLYGQGHVDGLVWYLKNAGWLVSDFERVLV